MTNPLKPEPFEPGTNWMPERGKLYRFTDRSVVVIRPWPLPQAWQKYTGGTWTPAAPRINLPLVELHLRRPNRRPKMGRAGEDAAWRIIPEDVREAVLQAHLAGYQWQALSMQARCPGARDLAKTAPMIAAMLSVGNRFRAQPVTWLLRSIRALLRTPDGWKRWCGICAWLGLDSSKSFVRMTRRAEIQPFAWTIGRWQAVLQLWATREGKKLLQHASRLTESHAHLLEVVVQHLPAEECARVIRPQLFEELAEAGGYTGASWALGTTLQMWPTAWEDRPLPALRSVEAIEQLRARSLERLMEVQASHHPVPVQEPRDFPPPPLQGTPDIRPLDSTAALKAEGLEMGHCIGNKDWPRYARLRWGYGYALTLGEERATLWLGRSPSEPTGFIIEQLRGPANASVSPAMIAKVQTWLATQADWARFHQAGGAPPPGPPLARLPETWEIRKKRDLHPITDILLDGDIPF
jgi:hypothetical protein